tara:strand:+ start:25609 stop:26235 length:627 start_codon:yes stop_codon:yes gene_type:complete
MNTRKSFLRLLRPKMGLNDNGIEISRFLHGGEKKQVFDSLEKWTRQFPIMEKYIADFRSLEAQRYQILEKGHKASHMATEELRLAIYFCNKSKEEKQGSEFRINPNLVDCLVSSRFPWSSSSNPEEGESITKYLFIPSFLELAPKELCLTNLNSILLDLLEFSETFSYNELLALMANALNEEPKELNPILLDFVTGQVLYYRTFLVVK